MGWRMRTPESYEKAEIKKYLDKIQAWYFLPYAAAFGRAGIPDIVGCYRGSFFSIEVKREGKFPTPLQIQRMSEITAAGGRALSGTAKAVIATFEELRTRGML